MEKLRAHLYASLLKSLAYLRIRYEALHIELRRRSKYYYLLISSNHIMGYHVDDVRIINTFRKHLLILLDILLMEYILREIGMEIIKPEYAYVIYLPLPSDADKVTKWRAGKGYMEVWISRIFLHKQCPKCPKCPK